MTKAEKGAMIESLTEKIKNNDFFYVVDSSTLTVESVNKLRSLCYEKEVEMQVVKNTLAIKALEAQETPEQYQGIIESLKGPTTIFFCDTANVPAKVIKEFRGDKERPMLKAAYIDASVYSGDDQLAVLAALKSREELIGDIIGLLQSPVKNVLGSLQSGGSTLSGLLKALEARG
jgi:large subunit ribosomal protein L10